MDIRNGDTVFPDLLQLWKFFVCGCGWGERKLFNFYILIMLSTKIPAYLAIDDRYDN
jgi:hypothetical protein